MQNYKYKSSVPSPWYLSLCALFFFYNHLLTTSSLSLEAEVGHAWRANCYNAVIHTSVHKFTTLGTIFVGTGVLTLARVSMGQLLKQTRQTTAFIILLHLIDHKERLLSISGIVDDSNSVSFWNSGLIQEHSILIFSGILRSALILKLCPSCIQASIVQWKAVYGNVCCKYNPARISVFPGYNTNQSAKESIQRIKK